MTALFVLDGAAFGYGGRTVLSGVTLRVEPGAFVGLVGPNGAGKTTLFRGLLGLVRPMGGTAVRHARAIGYVPQRETLDVLFPLTVREVVEMGCYSRLRGLRGLRAEERALALTVLERVGLAAHAREPFSSLSGGQRQRALIARALLVQPDVLLLDEPTSGVDRPAQRAILDLLLELNRRDGIAILLVSHELALVREAVREAWWVADGRVERGEPRELLSPQGLDRLFGAAGERLERS
ncbi:MAG: ABC transporter ATP-binding protein [Planctomycetes bacterium]|nr:ABC transporter ATP-binding protein [Planctomycetota bacterium]